MKTIPYKDWELINLIKWNEQDKTSIYDYSIIEGVKKMEEKGLIMIDPYNRHK